MFAKSSFFKFTQLINNLVSFAGSSVAVFSFCIAVYGFFYPAKIAEKVIDFETAFNEARNDLKTFVLTFQLFPLIRPTQQLILRQLRLQSPMV